MPSLLKHPLFSLCSLFLTYDNIENSLKKPYFKHKIIDRIGFRFNYDKNDDENSKKYIIFINIISIILKIYHGVCLSEPEKVINILLKDFEKDPFSSPIDNIVEMFFIINDQYPISDLVKLTDPCLLKAKMLLDKFPELYEREAIYFSRTIPNQQECIKFVSNFLETDKKVRILLELFPKLTHDEAIRYIQLYGNVEDCTSIISGS